MYQALNITVACFAFVSILISVGGIV